MSASIGVIIGFTQTGTSSIDPGSSASTAAQMFIWVLMRYTARTRCPCSTSNQNEPTVTFHFGSRAAMRSSRRKIRLPSGRVIDTESPLAKV